MKRRASKLVLRALERLEAIEQDQKQKQKRRDRLSPVFRVALDGMTKGTNPTTSAELVTWINTEIHRLLTGHRRR